MNINSVPFVTLSRALPHARRGTMFASLLSCMLLVLLIPGRITAQCPTNIPPTGSGAPAWTHATTPASTTIVCATQVCTVTVDYCYRIVQNWPTHGTTAYQIAMIGDIQLSGDCDDCSDEVIFNAVHEATLQDLGTVITFPPCGPEYTTYRVESYRKLCMKKLESGGYSASDCDSDSWCRITCEACYEYGHVLSFECSYDYIGDDDCDNYPNPWEKGDPDCYKICGGSQ